MTELHDLWRALEIVPNLAATRKEWRLRTGDGFPLLEPMLEPVGSIAEYMPCLTPQLGLHYHEVVEHGNGAAEAVLIDKYRDCPPFPIARHERAIMAPGIGVLAERLSEAMGFERAPSVSEPPGGSYEIGCYHPVEAFRFPVALSLSGTTVTSEEALLCAAAMHGDPFIFLTGTPKPIRGKVEALIAGRGILVASLSECLTVVDNGALECTPAWARSLSRFRNKHVPKPETARVFFATPPNTGWADVSIRFIDGHFAEVEAAGVTGRFNYTEMDMANHRECSPSRQWEFLEQIAENHRIIDFHMGDKTKNKSWKYELSSKLRDFFGIDDDPFWPYDPKTSSWEAKFNVIPVTDL